MVCKQHCFEKKNLLGLMLNADWVTTITNKSLFLKGKLDVLILTLPHFFMEFSVFILTVIRKNDHVLLVN